MEFLSSVRAFLHYRQGRDDNMLAWESQDEAAARHIGVSPQRTLDAAAWMRVYFRHARAVHYECLRLLESVPASRSSLYRHFQNFRSRLSNSDFSVIDGLVMLQMAAVFHPQLRQCTATHDGYLREHARTYQAAGYGQGMHWTAAKAFDVHASGGLAAAHLRHRLGQVAPAALIAVTHRLFAAVEHVGKRQRIELFLDQQGAHGHHRRGLAGEIFQQHISRQRGVFGVGCLHTANEAPVTQIERQGRHTPPARRSEVSFWHPGAEPLQEVAAEIGHRGAGRDR